jgi:hypothetical protein
MHHLWTLFFLCLSVTILHCICNMQLYIQAEVLLEFIYLREGSFLNSFDALVRNLNKFLEWQKAEVGLIVFCILLVEISQAFILEIYFWSYLSNTRLPGTGTFSKKKGSFTSKLDSNLMTKLIEYYIWSITSCGAKGWSCW